MASRFVYPATYIMASRPHGVLYTGSTNDLPKRAWEHGELIIPGFTKTNRCTMLVWYEPHEVMGEAIRRELAIKHWLRTWKLELIERMNPDWIDLYPTLA